MSETFKRGSILAITILLAALFFSQGCKSPANQDDLNSSGKTVADPTGEGTSGDQVAFWINDKPITEAELDTFGKLFFPKGESGHGHQAQNWRDNPLFLVKPFVRDYAFIEEARRRKIMEEKEIQGILDIARLNKIGRQYRGHLLSSTAVPAERLESTVPVEWVQMNFLLHRFDAPANAQKAYQRIQDEGIQNRGTIIVAEGGEYSNQSKSETGMIFRDSGFFTPFDDPYLFSLNKGDVSRPVETGIGMALAEVLDRRDFTQDEINAYLQKRIDQNSAEFGQKRMEGILRDSNRILFSEVIENAVRGELDGGRWDKGTVARVKETKITYYQFRRLFTPNFSYYIKVYGRDQVGARVQRDVAEVLDDVALGIYAQGQSEEFQPTGVEEFLLRRENQLAKAVLQERMFWEGEYTPSGEMIRNYYESNKEDFISPGAIHIYTYFTPAPEDINLLWERHESGTLFENLGEGLKSTEPSPHGGFATLKMKRRTIEKGSDELKSLQNALFSLELGDVRLLEADIGFYLVKVINLRRERKLGLAEATEEITSILTSIERKKLLEEKIRNLESQYDVRFVEDSEHENRPMKDNSMDTG